MRYPARMSASGHDEQVRTTASANAERWSADDDAWRGYKRVGDRLLLDERAERTLSLVEPRPGGAYLDVGCGPGVLTRLLSERVGAARTVGVDLTDLGVDFEHVQVDLDRDPTLPFADATFDVVSCLETLEHVHDTDLLARELRRVLKPDGYAIVSVPRLDALLAILMLGAGMQPLAVECSLRRRYGAPDEGTQVSGHVSHFTLRALKSLLRANGFTVDAIEQASAYTSWMFTQERPSPMVRLPLWVLSKIPFKKDDMILRVRPAR